MQTSRFLDPTGRMFFREVLEIAQRVFTATAELERVRKNVDLARENDRKAMYCERLLEELSDEPRQETEHRTPSKRLVTRYAVNMAANDWSQVTNILLFRRKRT